MVWHLAPSLVRLRGEINKRWPHRDKSSDGSLGDARHSTRTSDHNPNSRRSVNAIDVDKDGIIPSALIAAAKKHPSTNYIIYNRVIYLRQYGFRARRYTGANPHTLHVHISIMQSSVAENSTRSWGLATPTGGTATPVPKYPGLLKSGSKGTSVRTLQSRLNTRGYAPKLSVDGAYGPATVRNVKAFQRYAGIEADGLVGPVTWSKLWTLRVT